MLRRQFVRRRPGVTADCHHDLQTCIPKNGFNNNAVTTVPAVTASLAARLKTSADDRASGDAATSSETSGDNGDNGDSNEEQDVGQTVSIVIASPSTQLELVKTVTNVVPALWFSGVARLQFIRCPDGFLKTRWRRLQFDAAYLLDERGDDLVSLGWSELDVFGIHPTVPAVAHCSGLAACLNGGKVMQVAADHALLKRSTGSMLSFRRMPMPGAVPLWTLRGDNQDGWKQTCGLT